MPGPGISPTIAIILFWRRTVINISAKQKYNTGFHLCLIPVLMQRKRTFFQEIKDKESKHSGIAEELILNLPY